MNASLTMWNSNNNGCYSYEAEAIFTSRSRRVDLCTCLKEEIVETVSKARFYDTLFPIVKTCSDN